MSTQTAIDALQNRLENLSPAATPEELAYLGRALEAFGGKATVLDVQASGNAKIAELNTAATGKLGQISAAGDLQVQRVQAAAGRDLSRITRALARNYIGSNADGTVNPGGTTVSTAPTARLGNLLTATPFTDKGTWDASQFAMTAYRGGAVIQADDTPLLWGSPTNGRTGAINGNNRLPTPALLHDNQGAGLPAFPAGVVTKQIVTHYGTSYLLLSEGSVYATGYGGHGQQGDGSYSNKAFFAPIAFPGNAGPVRYLHIDENGGSYDAHPVFALMEDGDVYAWGYNAYGQLGLGDTNNRATPHKVATFDQNVRCVTSAGDFTAFITTDNKLYLCGRNNVGQIGNGNTNNVSTPYLALSNVAKASLGGSPVDGSSWVLALTTAGQVYAWGYNGSGQLGLNHTSNQTTPTLVSQFVGQTVVDVWACGTWVGQAAALLSTGDFYVWGYNGVGALGLGDTNNRNLPTLVNGIRFVSDVCCAGTTNNGSYIYHNLFVLAHNAWADRAARINGTLYSAGYNCPSLGRTGNSSSSFKPVALPSAAIGKISAVTYTGYHSGGTLETLGVALDMSGTVYLWGYPAGNFASTLTPDTTEHSPWKASFN